MVSCLFVGCMCSPCVRSRSSKTFREPMGNSLVLLQAIRDLFPVWDVSAEQALRAWILSMPSFLRARLDALSPDELQQLSGASPPPPATATVMTQTVRLFMPRSTARSLTSFDTTEPQNSMFTSTEATTSTASIRFWERTGFSFCSTEAEFRRRNGPAACFAALFRRSAPCFRGYAALFRRFASCFRGYAALFRRFASYFCGFAAWFGCGEAKPCLSAQSCLRVTTHN